jgi:O-antigen/teichoic acid export membrane protein
VSEHPASAPQWTTSREKGSPSSASGYRLTRLRVLLIGLVSEYRLNLATSYLLMATAMLAHIILVPRYLAALGGEGFGVLSMLFALITYVSVVGGGWLTSGFQRILGVAFATKQKDYFAESVGAARIVFVAYSLTAALAGIIVGAYQGQIATSTMVAVGIFFIASQEFQAEKLTLTATGRLAAANLMQIIQLVLYVASVIIALNSGWGLTGVFACHLISLLAGRLLVLTVGRGERPTARLPSFAAWRILLKQFAGRVGGGYIVASIIGISSQSDVLVIGALGGAHAATQFVLIWKIAEFFAQIMSRIPEMLTPILIRLDAVGNRMEIHRRYIRVLGLTATFAIPGGVAYALAGPCILRIWLGPEQVPDNLLGFWLAGASVVFLALTRPAVVFAEAFARLRLANIISSATLVARLMLSVVLYPRFGYIAPLVALTFVYACGAFPAYLWMGWTLVRGPQGSNK